MINNFLRKVWTSAKKVLIKERRILSLNLLQCLMGISLLLKNPNKSKKNKKLKSLKKNKKKLQKKKSRKKQQLKKKKLKMIQKELISHNWFLIIYRKKTSPLVL
jgi:hypothetical protein